MIELSQEQLDILRGYKTNTDDDNIRIKEIIKKQLIDDELIIYLLNNKELEDQDADPSDYLGINILPVYMIHPTQHNVQNFICYDIGWNESPRYNDGLKYLQVSFYILCEEKNIIEKMTGIARHDLIAARIKHIFNWTNKFGMQCNIVQDRPTIIDNDYASRQLVFELTTPKDMVKNSKIINKIGG